MPLLAMMNRRVMGPGTPSVRLSPLAPPLSSPSVAPASPDDELDEEPATSWKFSESFIRIVATERLYFVNVYQITILRSKLTQMLKKCNLILNIFW